MTAIVAIELVSPLTLSGVSTHFRQEFVEGDVPAGQYVQVDAADAVNFAVTPHNYWPDGSLRGARVTLRTNLVANIPKRINMVKRSSPGATGTPLTASVITGGPSVVVGCGSYGSIALSAMTVLRTYVSNKECVTVVYAGRVGTDPHLWAEVEATGYADGNISYDVRINNAFVESTGLTTKTYIPTITVGGTVKYNNGGGSVTHYPYSAPVRATVWSGTDPQIRPVHDTGYLLAAFVAPNPTATSTNTAILSGLAASSTYTPGANLRYTPGMGSTGYQEQIGPMSTWDMQYFIFKAAKPAYDCVMAHAKAINSYATVFASSTTLDPINYTTHATWGMSGVGTANWAGQGGGVQPATRTQDNTASLSYDDAHAPLASSYLAYCLKDGYLDLVSMVNLCRSHFLALGAAYDTAYGPGVNRPYGGQMRQRAWDTRTEGLTCSILPDSLLSVFGDIKTRFVNAVASDVAYYSANGGGGGQFGLLYVDGYGWIGDGYTQTPPVAGVALWQMDFYSNAVGWLRKVKPVNSTGMASLQTFHEYIAKSQLFRLGTPGVSTEYNPGRAAIYYHTFRTNQTTNVGLLPNMIVSTDPGQVDRDSNGVSSNPSTVTLVGTSAADPLVADSYWAQFVSALVWMVDLGMPGVLDKLNILRGATNWSTTQGATDKVTSPNFNFAIRSEYSPPLLYTATDSGVGAVVPTAGPSIRTEALPQHTAGFVVTSQPGIGTPGGQIAGVVAGADGTTPIYDGKMAAGGVFNPLSEYRVEPSSSLLFVDDKDLSEVYTGASSAYVSISVNTVEDGAVISSNTQNFGTAPTGSTVTSVTVSPTTALGSATFTAVVNGTNSPSQTVIWSVSGGGSITSAGVFTAPNPSNLVQTITITATSVQDGSKVGTATVAVPPFILIAKATTVTFAVVDQAGTPVNASGLDYAFYDQPRISAGYAPVKAGSDLAIQNGVATISIAGVTNLFPGDKGRIEWGDANGNKHGGGPVTVT